MDHLNIFNPYENKPLNHEDQLTRALLILVKNSKPQGPLCEPRAARITAKKMGTHKTCEFPW